MKLVTSWYFVVYKLLLRYVSRCQCVVAWWLGVPRVINLLHTLSAYDCIVVYSLLLSKQVTYGTTWAQSRQRTQRYRALVHWCIKSAVTSLDRIRPCLLPVHQYLLVMNRLGQKPTPMRKSVASCNHSVGNGCVHFSLCLHWRLAVCFRAVRTCMCPFYSCVIVH